MEQVGGLVHGHEPEEGPDGGQAGIAAPGAVATLAFDIGEEVTHPFSIEILDCQFRRGAAGLFAGEAQEQSEGIAITGDRVRARVHLGAEPIGEAL